MIACDIMGNMENNNIQNEEAAKDNVTLKQQISTPTAIIVAGFLIMVGILITKTGGNIVSSKTLSEQVGVSKVKMDACIKGVDVSKVKSDIDASVNKAMSNYGDRDRGTPFSVIIGQNGAKTDIRGAESYDVVKKAVENVIAGKVERPYTGNIELSEPTDHIMGNKDAKVTIIEYSDFECPFCKQFHPTLERIVKENNGNVAWIYRHYPLHQHSFEKLLAANCVAEIKGDDAFWKYSDLLFGLLKTANDSVSDQL